MAIHTAQTPARYSLYQCVSRPAADVCVYDVTEMTSHTHSRSAGGRRGTISLSAVLPAGNQGALCSGDRPARVLCVCLSVCVCVASTADPLSGQSRTDTETIRAREQDEFCQMAN